MSNLDAYHNAFYATCRDDLKYKKNREKYSFDIRFSYGDESIIIARSYATDIAVIDNKEKIMIMSKSRYSMTTGKQLDQLRSACPADYKIIKYDYERFSWVCSHEQIKEIIKRGWRKSKRILTENGIQKQRIS